MAIVTYRYEIESNPCYARVFTVTRALDQRVGNVRLPCVAAEEQGPLSRALAHQWVSAQLVADGVEPVAELVLFESNGRDLDWSPWIVKDTTTAHARYEGTR